MIIAMWNIIETVLLFIWGVSISYAVFILSPYVFKILSEIILQKIIKPQDYFVLNVIAYLLFLNSFFYLGPFYKNIIFVNCFIISILISFVGNVAQEMEENNPPLYCYLKNVFTVSCIQSKLLKIICFILGLFAALFMAFFCRKIESLLIVIPIILGFISPFVLASLIKAFFYPQVFQQLFTIPSAPEIKLSPEPLNISWDNEIRYRPVFFILFYLASIYSIHLLFLDSFEKADVIGVGIVISILLLMTVLNRKLSFIIPPIAFILIIISLLWLGSSFTVLELTFFLVVLWESFINFGLQRLADNQQITT